MPALQARRIRACLGGLWLLDAILQAQPHCFSHDWWHNDLTESVMGQPRPISDSILWATHHLAARPALANTAAVAVQAAIGLCLLLGRFERIATAASIPWALAVWWVGEGLGALATGFALLPAGAPGPVLLYPLLGILSWPRPAENSWVGRPSSAPAVAWCVIWSGGALLGLPWRFGAARMLQANIEQNELGQPNWLSGPAHSAYTTVGSHPALLPGLLFLAQVGVGLGVLRETTRRYALAGGVGLAVVFWIAVQGMGGLAGGTATDPGSAPLLVLLALTVACACRTGDQRRFTHPSEPSTRMAGNSTPSSFSAKPEQAGPAPIHQRPPALC